MSRKVREINRRCTSGDGTLSAIISDYFYGIGSKLKKVLDIRYSSRVRQSNRQPDRDSWNCCSSIRAVLPFLTFLRVIFARASSRACGSASRSPCCSPNSWSTWWASRTRWTESTVPAACPRSSRHAPSVTSAASPTAATWWRWSATQASLSSKAASSSSCWPWPREIRCASGQSSDGCTSAACKPSPSQVGFACSSCLRHKLLLQHDAPNYDDAPIVAVLYVVWQLSRRLVWCCSILQSRFWCTVLCWRWSWASESLAFSEISCLESVDCILQFCVCRSTVRCCTYFLRRM